MNKKQKDATKYPYPRSPITNEYITHFNKLERICWSKANVRNF